MADIIEGISPTRMELLKLSRRVTLAEKGHQLLKEKRDALVAEFLDVVGDVQRVRRDVEKRFEVAFRELVAAQAMIGVDAVRGVSLTTSREIPIDIGTRNIMGVKVPLIEAESVRRSAIERGYTFADTASSVDECAKHFEEALDLVIKLAEVEETVKNLAREVEKTKRRVNALEYIVIPRLVATRKYIRMRLEEMERENFSRLKKIKAALEAKG
ncbi:MAG TPA: V-type ATP synthase subunit D [Candidatus Syntrophoarchaeum butanivorans]|uniref:A-type ATP synthase subunit D n=1 Tax=Candidatus Syntropharchaeum butanivorans TaxID=1839936 RepID=A0A1F2P4W3_9EURY|nr:MAG: V-type ATP synthase, subunit D [Candidatus Syntrophoarchaeum butanivorans]HEC56918.1 V-type ATP synthase subunit D [Candidatus Syntrophoarchaeum butanivorans]